MAEKKISKAGEDAINTETMLQLQQIGREMAKATTVDAMDEASKKFFKSAKTIKKSRGGMINGNDLVASYYDKG